MLEAIEDRLPVWACWKGDKLIKARSYREPHQKPQRRAALLPSELFAINWASSGPGFDWPVQYHLVWTPIYDRFVVTASADCPDFFGYADFALGHFAETTISGSPSSGSSSATGRCSGTRAARNDGRRCSAPGWSRRPPSRRVADQVWPQEGEDEERTSTRTTAP